MKNVITYTLLICLLLMLTYANATTVNSNTQVHSLYLDKGQETDYTYKIIQDQQGYIWSATDHGLKRYDGYQVTQFLPEENNPKSIGSTNIVEMLIYDDVFWLGGNELSQFHPETENFSNYEVSNYKAIWALHQDNSQMIWIGGEGFGLRGFDLILKQVTKHYFKGSLARFIYDIEPDKITSNLWISSSDGLYLFSPKTGLIEQHLKLDELHSKENVIGKILVDNKGKVWIASKQGLFIYDPITHSKRHYSHDKKDFN